MESVVVFIYIIVFFGVMAFIVWIIVSYFSGLQERKIEEEYQHLQDKHKAYIHSIRPIIKENYLRLIYAVRDNYPLIKFKFPSLNKILESIPMLTDNGKNLKEVIEESLAPIVTIAEENYVNADPPIMSVHNNSANIPPVIKEKNNNNGVIQAEPTDWQKTRKLVYERDNHSCKRCGTHVELNHCHIHHLIRRSKGGGNCLNNLVTLCIDCHSLMSGHSPMQRFLYYYISTSRMIHCSESCAGMNAKKIRSSLKYLENNGYVLCSKCNPEKADFEAIYNWEPHIKKFATQQLLLILDTIKSPKSLHYR